MPGAAGVVFWDFDGTLAERAGRWSGALLTALDAVVPGHDISLDALRAGLSRGFPWHAHEVPHQHLSTPTLWWAELGVQLRRVFTAVGVDPARHDELADAVRVTYLDTHAWSVFDDVRPSLQRLLDAGWSHAILSNHVPELDDLVRRLGLGDLVEAVVTSAVTGFEKPHPAMFRAGLQRMGHPRRVWMVGDNPVADVDGARAVGIPALLVRTPDPSGATTGLNQAADRILRPGRRGG